MRLGKRHHGRAYVEYRSAAYSTGLFVRSDGAKDRIVFLVSKPLWDGVLACPEGQRVMVRRKRCCTSRGIGG